jgi:hypothetical protein
MDELNTRWLNQAIGFEPNTLPLCQSSEESMGFEPMKVLPFLVFKTSSINPLWQLSELGVVLANAFLSPRRANRTPTGVAIARCTPYRI